MFYDSALADVTQTLIQQKTYNIKQNTTFFVLVECDFCSENCVVDIPPTKKILSFFLCCCTSVCTAYFAYKVIKVFTASSKLQH